MTNYDPYAGTPYRHLETAEAAVRMARFQGSDETGIGYDRSAALDSIERAISALKAARRALEARA